MTDTEYPPYKLDLEVIKKIEAGESSEEIVACIKRRYLGKEKAMDNFYSVWNFMPDGKEFGICFDFNNVRTMNIEVFQKMGPN